MTIVCGLGGGAPRPLRAAPVAATDEDKAAAVKLLDKGNAAFAAGRVAAALAHFEAAYKRYPSPKIWFNLGEAHRALKQDAAALSAYERFIRDAGDQVPAERVAVARARIEALRANSAAAPAPQKVAPPAAAPPAATPPAAMPPAAMPPAATPPAAMSPAAAPPAATSPHPAAQPPGTLLIDGPTAERATRRTSPPLKLAQRSVWRSPLVIGGYALTGALAIALAGTGGVALTYDTRYQDPGRSLAERIADRDTGGRLAWAAEGLLIGALAVGVATTTYALVVQLRGARAQAR